MKRFIEQAVGAAKRGVGSACLRGLGRGVTASSALAFSVVPAASADQAAANGTEIWTAMLALIMAMILGLYLQSTRRRTS